MNRNTDLLLTGQRIKRLYDEMCQEVMHSHSLTRSEVDVLLFLANNAPCDTAKDIAELRGLSKSRVCQSVDNLSRRGFLSTERDQQDRRCIHLRLEAVSEPAVREAREIQRRFLEILYSGITPEERTVLACVSEKMIKNIEEAASHAG